MIFASLFALILWVAGLVVCPFAPNHTARLISTLICVGFALLMSWVAWWHARKFVTLRGLEDNGTREKVIARYEAMVRAHKERPESGSLSSVKEE
jgi:hypothetical protein